MLKRIKECVRDYRSFAFESTLSGTRYARKIKEWRTIGYQIIIYYFYLPSVDLAISRVKVRVSKGGHNIPTPIIKRRFSRSWNNFTEIYRHVVDSWVVIDTSGVNPVIIEESR